METQSKNHCRHNSVKKKKRSLYYLNISDEHGSALTVQVEMSGVMSLQQLMSIFNRQISVLRLY